MKKNLTTTILVAVVVAVVAFLGGVKYQQMQFASANNGGNQFFQRNANGRPNGSFAQRGGMMAGRGVVGEVISADSNSITVKLTDGSSKIVNVTKSTTYTKSDSAALTDIKAGTKIAAFGVTNSDGSVTAQNVQLNPTIREGQGNPNGNGQTQQPISQ